ncbi:MAG: hypothetical protein JNG86_06405, partial [Verrucomicrobiaceae bacterium]|nr:hypothetical protein [Verrucomicrobiaceae bacterium]
MKPARWIIAASLFAVLWSVGAFVLLPRMQEKLARAAHDALTAQNTLAGRLGRVQVRFEGQTAFLSGKVRVPQETKIIEKTVEQLVRAPTLLAAGLGTRLNPVAAVKNDLEVAPYPPGWMLLASHGGKARLTGTAATDHEGRDLLHAITDKWNSQGGQATGTLSANLTDHDEVDDISATLESAPVPPATPSPRVEAWLARIGGRFEPVKLAQDDTALRDHAARVGIGDAEWDSQVLPLLRDLRHDHQTALAREKETARLAALPLGHLFLAVRDQRVILAGTVGSAAIKRALLDEALKVFATLRVHDDIRV